ncbi:hypothetical protein B9T31_16895 [Acinetobacter sp. ANC 4558]|uniref:hypothetical protein n=1 Tax=Acinetobacter sp. ANC 4558 TaxID=1977876 RepID=UPI000A35AACE|nr:hypothetical protein [Acinetobacter sp. ANC 4558]OTG79566.1 hypothetical protein B9T31_16895 [Acinetobacter sp. ANC 4558]
MHNLELYINDKKKLFSEHHFFQKLYDPQIELSKKLEFLPYLAHFIMSFGDINKYVIPFRSPKDQYEKIINTHAEEDAHHWPWYIDDLKALGLDKNQSITQTLEFLWSEKLAPSRELSYKLISLLSNQSAIIRYIVIEVMEATGNVTFKVLKNITHTLNPPLKFCGQLHLSHETGHTITEDENLFEKYTFSDQDRLNAQNIINECFDAFSYFMDQLNDNLNQLLEE